MDISKLKTKELNDLLARIPDELNKRELQEKAKLLDEFSQIASKCGYTLKELIGKVPRSSKGKKAGAGTRARKPVSAKYRDPQHPNLTWTGRGRKPRWVTEWLAKGKTMEALAISPARN